MVYHKISTYLRYVLILLKFYTKDQVLFVVKEQIHLHPKPGNQRGSTDLECGKPESFVP